MLHFAENRLDDCAPGKQSAHEFRAVEDMKGPRFTGGTSRNSFILHIEIDIVNECTPRCVFCAIEVVFNCGIHAQARSSRHLRLLQPRCDGQDS
jgi:hypothetical protein